MLHSSSAITASLGRTPDNVSDLPIPRPAAAFALSDPGPSRRGAARRPINQFLRPHFGRRFGGGADRHLASNLVGAEHRELGALGKIRRPRTRPEPCQVWAPRWPYHPMWVPFSKNDGGE